ncbi:uncharacterized [Tachysurus ichikawai]
MRSKKVSNDEEYKRERKMKERRRRGEEDGRTDKTAQRKENASETFGLSLSHSSEGSSQDLPPTERRRERGNLSLLSTGQQLEARNNLDCSVAHSRQSETLYILLSMTPTLQLTTKTRASPLHPH